MKEVQIFCQNGDWFSKQLLVHLFWHKVHVLWKSEHNQSSIFWSRQQFYWKLIQIILQSLYFFFRLFTICETVKIVDIFKCRAVLTASYLLQHQVSVSHQGQRANWNSWATPLRVGQWAVQCRDERIDHYPLHWTLQQI